MDTATTEINTLSLHDALPILLVRDRIGVKPLYFYHQNGRLIFASEIKAILQHPAVTADIDEQDRKSTRLNSSHLVISYAVFCLKKKRKNDRRTLPDHHKNKDP